MARLDLRELAAHVSDGDRVDWKDAERSASTDAERRCVQNLRLVEGLVAAHRNQDLGELSSEDTRRIGSNVLPFASGDAGETVVDDEPTVQQEVARWGGLELRGKIGEGAYGEVYRAWDPNLDREVALKLIKPDPGGGDKLASKVLKEGRVLARVVHPNVVTVYGAESHDGRVGLWMEFVHGRSLAGFLREQGKLGAREAALIGLDLCRALAAVHGAGLLHRDIKAQNVMRQEGGRILLMDFGAVHDLQDLEGADIGSITGTPLYIAPEVFAGGSASPQSDIYSVGVLLYHLVTRSFPVIGKTLSELSGKHLRGERRLLRDVRPDLPESFVKVVQKALAGDPGERFATAGEMEQALSACLGVDAPSAPPAQEPIRATRPDGKRRTPVWLVAAVVSATVVALALIGYAFVLRPAPETQPEPPAEGQPSAPERVAAEPRQAVPAPVPSAEGDRQTETRQEPDAATATAGEVGPEATPQKGPAPPVHGTYTVETALFRAGSDGARERLGSGARLALGDRLWLEFMASKRVYLYVINRDEQGRAYALYPLPDLDTQNPLPAGRRLRIPGTRGGSPISWQVDTPGGREHLLVLVSPERQVEFEAEMMALARPGQAAVALPELSEVRVRGIGGLAQGPEPGQAAPGTAARLFELAEEIAGDKSEAVEGVWYKRFELVNPQKGSSLDFGQ